MDYLLYVDEEYRENKLKSSKFSELFENKKLTAQELVDNAFNSLKKRGVLK